MKTIGFGFPLPMFVRTFFFLLIHTKNYVIHSNEIFNWEITPKMFNSNEIKLHHCTLNVTKIKQMNLLYG